MEHSGILTVLAGVILTTLLYLKSELPKRPTFKEADDKYKSQVACDEIVKRIEEHIECIPEMRETITRVETKVDILLKNGKK